MKFLPPVVEGLQRRFHELYKEFTRQGKHEHRNEHEFLLDDLLRNDGINRERYTQLNNILAESLGSGIEEEETAEGKTNDEEKSRKEKDKTLIRSTTEYLIHHDKKELLDF